MSDAGGNDPGVLLAHPGPPTVRPLRAAHDDAPRARACRCAGRRLIHRISAAGTACIANIGRAERRRRLAFGVVAFALGVVVFAALLLGGTDRWWRLALVVLFFPAAVGYFQWRDRTCVALAARDQRKLGEHAEHIEDADELAAVRAQARGVQRKALAASAAPVVVALLVP